MAYLLPVSDVTDFRRVVRVPSAVGQGAVKADQRRQRQDVTASGYREVVP